MIASRQQGFTLVELLVAVVITGMIAGVLGTAVSQFITVSNHGTDRLAALDEVQNAARWVMRDAQSAAIAGTPVGCTGDCTILTLSVPNSSATLTYEAPVAPYMFGTLSISDGSMGTITYTAVNDTLVRTYVPGGGTPTTITVARDVDVGFSVPVVSGTRDRYYVTMNITAPLDSGGEVEETYHIYLRCTGE